MKTLATILIFCGLSFAQGTELLRPTADADQGAASWVTNNCGINTYVNNATAGDLARDTGGLTTSVNYSVGSSGVLHATARTWLTWASTSNSYSALTLNVSASSIGKTGSSGTSKVVYSTDGGSTWTLLSTPVPGSPQATTTVTLNAGQDLTKLRVAACTSASTSDPGTGTNNVRVYDIWTVGTLGAPAAGNGSGSGTAVQPVTFN